MRNCTDDETSEHLDGRAWDWHADVEDPAAFAAATDLLNWLMAEGPDGQVGVLGTAARDHVHRLQREVVGLATGHPRAGAPCPTPIHTPTMCTSPSRGPAPSGKTSFWDGTVAKEDYGPCRPYAGEPAPLHVRKAPNRRPCGYPPRLTRTSSKPGRLLWRGSESKEVLAVQTRLGVPGANGFFGPATMRAVADYQRRNSLTPSGAVDTLTRSALVRDGVLKN